MAARRVVLAGVLWLAAASVHASAPGTTLLAYLRTAGGLAEAAEGYVKQFDNQVTGPQVRVVAQLESASEPGKARRLVFQPGGARQSVVSCGDMDSPAAVADFLRWGRQQASTDRLLLLALAHGRAPSEEASRPGELRVPVLAQALAATGTAPDAIFLDSCYSGSVENLDVLRGEAGYLVAAPGLLYAPGLPWGRILAALNRQPEMSTRDLCDLAVDETRRFWRTQPDISASLVAVDLAQAPRLVQAARHLALTALPLTDGALTDLTVARGQALSWGPQGEIVEAGAWAETLAALTASPPLAAAAQQMGQAARAATLAAWSQGLGDRPRRVAGPGIFFPLRLAAWPARYVGDAPDSLTAAWGPFLRTYLQEMTTKAALAGREQPAP